ncbi:hypothetical protein SFRURICE_005441, partial [Spodoptera frugiperda]
MSSIPRHTTRRLSRCYWRFEDRAHRALCLESRALSGARDDVGSLDSFAGGCAGVRFDSRVGAKTLLHTALTVSHSRPATLLGFQAGGNAQPPSLLKLGRRLISMASLLHTAYVFFESGCDVAASFPDVTRATVARYHVYPGNCQWILSLGERNKF